MWYVYFQCVVSSYGGTTENIIENLEGSHAWDVSVSLNLLFIEISSIFTYLIFFVECVQARW